MSERGGRPAQKEPYGATLRVLKLFLSLEARRRWNRVQSVMLRRKGGGKRTGTRRKSIPSKLLLGVLGLVFGFNVITQSTNVVREVALAAERDASPEVILLGASALSAVAALDEERNDERSADAVQEHRLETFRWIASGDEGILEAAPREARAQQLDRWFAQHGRAGFAARRVDARALFPSTALWAEPERPLAMLGPLGAIGSLLLFGVMLLSAVGADRDLARTESVLEWWFTFPVSARALLLSRALGTALVTPIIWVCVLPFFWVIFWCAGLGAWWGLSLALGATLYVGAMAGALRVVFETGLGWLFSLRYVAYVQTGLEFFGLTVLMLASSVSVSKPALAFALRETRELSWWTVYNPLALPLGWLVSPGLGAAAGLLTLVVALLTIYGAVSLGSFILRDGLIESTGPLRGPRGRSTPKGVSARVRSQSTVLVRHELLSLTREPARLMRVVALPLLLVGVNAMVNPQVLEGILTSPRHAATIAFAIGVFSLSTTGLLTLANEGHGLWLLYTLPASIVNVLAQKALVWSAIAGALGAVVLATIALVAQNGALFWSPYAALALVGVLLHGMLAVALGTLGTNVFETARENRVQPLTVQLFMLLAIMFGYAIYAPSLWGKFVQLCMSSLLAFALWQKVQDHAPYFLDPTELPPPRIAVSDGLLTALGFFVMQGCLMLMLGASGVPASIALLFAFVGAGVIVAGTAVYGFVRMGVPNLMVAIGLRAPAGRPLRAVLQGVAAGAIGGAFALAYQVARERISWLQFLGEGEPTEAPAELATMLAVLAVCAAPPLEELIFRGIIHRGFRRSLRTLPAVVASSLIFALVHPPVAFVPVFVMALLAATVFERSRLLIGAVTTHMVYNAIIVGAQWWID